MRRFALAVAVCALLYAPARPASAWGSFGHRIVNDAAIDALPPMIPDFVGAARVEISLLGPEADRIRGAGRPLDADDDPAHFVDVGDDLTVAGVPLRALPPSREAYDSALRARGTTEYVQGYLPYAIADGYEHLVRDFAYWRIDEAAARTASAADQSFFLLDRRLREMLIVRDIGYWAHFVGDGSQPLHASVHFNGWNSTARDAFPNPEHFSNSHTVHSRFETALVNDVASATEVRARMPQPVTVAAPILTEVGRYLSATAAGVPTVYRLEAAGAIDRPSVASRDFVLGRLAAGAAELRDLIVAAWVASAQSKVGYPRGVAPADVEAGKVVPTPALVGEAGA